MNKTPVTTCYRLLQVYTTDCYRLLQIVTDCYRLLQIVTDCDRLWQIVTDCDRLPKNRQKVFEGVIGGLRVDFFEILC